ncbi:MAG: response regulator [Anaerolineae bacterium]|jgi:signal transduction histidine kinase
MAASKNRHIILVVEDEPHILEIVCLLLEDEGYRVLKAFNGKEAFEMASREMPDLIISDIKMPGMDGFTLCERVRRNPDMVQMPFIFLTAKGERADVRRGMVLGADDYLTKPFEPDELIAAVATRLSRVAETQAAIERVGTDVQNKIIRTLSHEFRTPLSLIIGYTELLEAKGQEMVNNDFETVLEGLHTGSARLMRLVEDFLLLSRLNTGALARQIREGDPASIAPDPVVALCIREFQAEASARQVTLSVDLGATGVGVSLLQQHLVEIVERLVDNAIKFSKRSGGRVQVTTKHREGDWLLKVVDEGIGIRPEALPTIFEAFRQVDRSELEQQGSGVGLTIVHGLVEAYGGRISAESRRGEGSTFSVWLPATRQPGG